MLAFVRSALRSGDAPESEYTSLVMQYRRCWGTKTQASASVRTPFVRFDAPSMSAASGRPANGPSHRSGISTHDHSLVAAVSQGLSLHRS